MPPVTCGVGHPTTSKNDITLIDEFQGADWPGTGHRDHLRPGGFGYLTDQMIRRAVHKSVQALEADIRAWIENWNQNPRPFTWTKTAERSWTHWQDT
jgi:hypothetical protein